MHENDDDVDMLVMACHTLHNLTEDNAITLTELVRRGVLERVIHTARMLGHEGHIDRTIAEWVSKLGEQAESSDPRAAAAIAATAAADLAENSPAAAAAAIAEFEALSLAADGVSKSAEAAKALYENINVSSQAKKGVHARDREHACTTAAASGVVAVSEGDGTVNGTRKGKAGRQCVACGSTAADAGLAKLLKCSVCTMALAYCSAACQLACWPAHKAECKANRKASI